MDLSRAKTVLIIAFLALNIFLGYQIVREYQNEGTGTAVTSEELGGTKTILQENNYYLRVSVPRLTQKNTFLRVAPVKLNRSRVLQLFFPDQAQIQQDVNKNGTITYYQGSRLLTLYPSGRLVYECNIEQVRKEQPDKAEALQEAENFLNVKELKPENAVLDHVETSERNKTVIVHYYQEYHEYPIFSGYAKVTVSSQGVESADIYWLRPLGLSEREELDVIPATLALRRFAEEFGPAAEPAYITNLTFGFYSREYDAEMWEMAPVWRLQLNGRSDQIYFINALTGNIEE